MLDAVRKATLISIYAIILRATLDAKTYDWCFYVLGAVGIACYLLIRVEEAKAAASLDASRRVGSDAKTSAPTTGAFAQRAGIR